MASIVSAAEVAVDRHACHVGEVDRDRLRRRVEAVRGGDLDLIAVRLRLVVLRRLEPQVSADDLEQRCIRAAADVEHRGICAAGIRIGRGQRRNDGGVFRHRLVGCRGDGRRGGVEIDAEHLGLHGGAAGVAGRAADAQAPVDPRHHEAAVPQRRDLRSRLVLAVAVLTSISAPDLGARRAERLRLDVACRALPR